MGRRTRLLLGLILPLVGVGLVCYGVARARAAGASRRPATVLWGTPGVSAPGTFNKPRCVAATPDGQIHALDLTGRLQRFTETGEFLGMAHMPTVALGRPQGMTADAAGLRYVADTHYNRVVIFGADDEIVRIFGEAAERPENARPGQLYWPCAIAVAPDGTIYTAEYGGHDRIQRWTPEGVWLASFGRFGSGPGEFRRPSGLAFDAAGNLYVADAANHRIQYFSPEGRFIRQWSGGRAAGLGFTEDGEPIETADLRPMAEDPSDEDSWGKRGSDTGGSGSAAEADLDLYYPYGVAVDEAGRVWVVESGSGRVQWFSPEGRRLGWWGGPSRGPGGLWSPWSLTVAPGGGVYVADTHNCRILRVPFP